MGLIRDFSKAQLAFQIAGGDVGQWQVNRYRGTEGLCRLYRFEIELTAVGETIDLDDAVGRPAMLSIDTDNGRRRFHGIVSRFELTGESPGQQHFRAELVPAVWQLTHRYDSRIFQKKTVVEIVSAVLEAAGIASDQYDVSLLQGKYRQREYCVQYRETDYNFIARLLEEEGIWWFFQQTEAGHVFRLADSKPAYEPIDAESATLPYQPPTGLIAAEEHVFRFRLGRSVRPGAVTLNDFNFKNPQLNLQVSSDLGRDAELEFYDYPGEYDKQASGTALAKIRTEEFETRRVVGSGQSNSPRLAPGREFGLTGHPTTSLNARYLITAVTHEGKQAVLRTSNNTNGQFQGLNPQTRQGLLAARRSENAEIRELAEGMLQISTRLGRGDPTARRELTDWLYHAGQVSRDAGSTAAALGGNPLEALSIPNLVEDVARRASIDFDAPVYECRFECIPASVTFRPARITPWPVMRGTQTAQVVGRPGEDIDTDEFGRVKVQFNWDREGKFDESSSCWIRVSQGWAGAQFGMMFLPRIGQEVIVDFLEGDPDKPIITGRVYNADHMPPYKLPEEKTKSTIKTLSSPGGKRYHEIRFEDRQNREQLFIRAQRRMDTRVVGTHFHTSASLHELVGGTKDGEQKGKFFRTVHEGNELHDLGDQFEQIEKLRHVVVGEDAIDALLQNYNQFVKGNAEVKVDGRMVFNSQKEIAFYVGNNFIRITPDGIQLHGSQIKLNCSDATPPDGIVGKHVQLPLDASPADDGKPGKRRRGGGGGGGGGGGRARRKRRTLFLEGAPGPVVDPPDKREPPKTTKTLTITATCQHRDKGVRSVSNRGILEVVPDRSSDHLDRITLTAASQPATAIPAEWTISSVGKRTGSPTEFQAQAPIVPALRTWFPINPPKKKYLVSCQDGNNEFDHLEVIAYPAKRDINFNEDNLRDAILGVKRKLESIFDLLGIEFELPKNISFDVDAGWEEHSDHQAFFGHKIQVTIDPLLKGGDRINFPVDKLLNRTPLGRVVDAVSDINAFLKFEGKIGCNLRTERTSPEEGLIGKVTGGVTGQLKISIGIEAADALKITKVTGDITGVLTATGKPFMDSRGFGIELTVRFDGLTANLVFDYRVGKKPFSATIYEPNDPVIFGTEKLYFHSN